STCERCRSTRWAENFFTTCHELGDWIEEQTGLPATDYAKAPPTLELCDAMAQTAKHHTRQRGKDPVTAHVSVVHGDLIKHADIVWTRKSGGSGTEDALDLANRCIAEWEKFFQQNSLDPES
ncbi:MAG: hypothetical protein J2P17_19660, partial [Mycobacterium sp.]|nr:hypothetical protein [Mycobacterium sp.]